jgi:uroporphyrinogen-III synthase
VIKKHRKEKFLLPCSNVHKQDITETLTENEIDYSKAVIYKTLCSNLSDVPVANYDMIVFFSPSGVKSLFKNFPKFKQNSTRIAAFGATTVHAIMKSKLKLDVQAPVPQAPSMTMAIEQYLKKANKS